MDIENLTLITGATGFLGRHITHAFKNKELKFLSLGRSSQNDILCDLSKEAPALSQKLKLVIHCAALAHCYPKNAEDKKEFYDNHLVATENLLKSLASNLCDKFIFVSSVAVYGQDMGHAISEDFPPHPTTVYGECKLKAEDMILAWGKKYEVPVYIFRLPLVVGDNPPGNLGSMIKAIVKKYYVYIKNVNPKKSMVLASDVADLFSSNQLNQPGIYNLTDGYDPSMRDIENCIIRKYKIALRPIGVPFFIIKLAAMIGDIFSFFPINSIKIKKLTTDLTFDDKKARLKLNWKPQRVIDVW